MRAFAAPPWPLPALAAWGGAWAVHAAAIAAGAAPGVAFAAAAGVGAIAALPAATRMRRLLVAGGFPLSAAAAGVAGLPGWAWLAPLLALALLYPHRAWRDAPLFPTPAGALDGLAEAAPLAPGARVLDAGCGAGHGLVALRRAYPHAALEGTEWSAAIALVAKLRCRGFARVKRGDLWADDWRGLDLVYLFQRPESMPRAWQKAQRELRRGAWLASLEFAVPGVAPTAVLGRDAARPVWLYRIGHGASTR
jgi:hypothetical protein